jgi:hypothetical protein
MLYVQKDVWGACTVGYILGKTSPHNDFVTFTWRKYFERLFIFATQKVDGSAVPSISSLGQAKQRWNLRAHHFFWPMGR